MSKRRKKKKNNIVSNIILVIALCVFVYAGYNLYVIFSEYGEGTKEYNAIKESVVIETQEEVEGEEEKILQIDFAQLSSINSDIVGWIDFDKLDISYPVVRGQDNAKYLKTTFEGKQNSSGTLFVDYQNNGDFKDSNTFIYGHNMKNGSMFGKLRKFKSAEFLQVNPNFYIYTPDGMKATYKIFAVSIVEDSSEIYNKYYATEEEFLDYQNYVMGKAMQKASADLNSQSRIVSLSTCTNRTETERLVVQGVLVEQKQVVQ